MRASAWRQPASCCRRAIRRPSPPCGPGSEAARQKLRPGDKIEGVNVLNERPSPFLFAIPAIALLLGLALLQRRRRALRPAIAA